ncbi:2096_t:CDS:2 [Funneliformis mosseae]|uniref:2096_t:CDS:1 n=1 Tax=Funneliformis mosseae TaxID=27381 RepID=A0A9N9FFQ1_FUNMO|nr:2096_t:CDS:2 [Funneliformis mosseae]
MCFQVTCQTCQKYTWQGCGKHIDSVMSKIPVEERCTCKKDVKEIPGTPMDLDVKTVALLLGLLITTYWWLSW